jgi:hypothetical protein
VGRWNRKERDMKVYAKLTNPEYGYDHDKEMVRDLMVGEVYEAQNISVGRYQSHFSIVGKGSGYNTVQFEFFNERMEPIDIYRIPEFSGYGL